MPASCTDSTGYRTDGTRSAGIIRRLVYARGPPRPVHLGNDAEARKWARDVNEYAADLVRADPDRFGLFATLTLPDVEGAIAEAEYALDTLHADGVVLLASNAGRYLGDPGFAPLLAYLHSRQAIVFVHPGDLPGDPVPGIPSFTADFLLDTTRTAISLILSGAMKEYDRIKFILAHAGGFVPYIAYRILLTMVSQENKARQRTPLQAATRQAIERANAEKLFPRLA